MGKKADAQRSSEDTIRITPKELSEDQVRRLRGLEPEDRRFYSRLRERIREWAAKKGPKRAKTVEYVMAVPDVFVLLLRLIGSPSVAKRSKLMLAAVVAYIVFPFDLMPEGLLGPGAFIEDLVLAVYAITRIIDERGADFVRRHWSGDQDILELVTAVSSGAQKILNRKIFTGVTGIFERMRAGKTDVYDDMTSAEDPRRMDA
jgi:uncharacterized membrane protein YkvA (DUF1232 family)